jgi:hypothetical protein
MLCVLREVIRLRACSAYLLVLPVRPEDYSTRELGYACGDA